SELLPARVLPRSPGATGQASRRFGAVGRAALGGKAQRLHAAVRGAGAVPVPRDAVCGRGATGRRELAPGGGDCRTLRGPGARAGGLLADTGTGDRRNLEGAWTRLRDHR